MEFGVRTERESTMTNVLLVIPPGTRPRRSLAYALERARRDGAGLVALVTLDPYETERLASRLDAAFMGERVSDRVLEILAREQHTRAEELLEEIGAQAKEAGIAFVPLVDSGDTSEVCRRVIRHNSVSCAVLVAEKRSWLTKLLSRSAAVHIPALEGCEIQVVEEDDEQPVRN
jgi:nucleotide-binding universal stress UspA family protein